MNFVTFHYTSNEDWIICVEHINAIRHNHNKEYPGDNGVWIYLTGDSDPVKVTESIEEVIQKISEVKSY